MVGNSKDQDGFKGDRLQQIMSSCGAFVSIIPHRGAENATAGEPPYKNFLAEIKLAQELNLPMLVFADPRIKLVGGSDEAWIRVPTNSKEIAPEGERQLGSLFHSWRNPREPHFVFLATDLDGPTAAFDRDVRRLIETITGMPTVVGPDLMTNNIQDAIMESISKAFLVIADISGDDNYRFNIDVSMEAAIARAQGRNLRLIARGEERRPPFMLRTAGQLRDISQRGRVLRVDETIGLAVPAKGAERRIFIETPNTPGRCPPHGLHVPRLPDATFSRTQASNCCLQPSLCSSVRTSSSAGSLSSTRKVICRRGRSRTSM